MTRPTPPKMLQDVFWKTTGFFLSVDFCSFHQPTNPLFRDVLLEGDRNVHDRESKGGLVISPSFLGRIQPLSRQVA